MLQSNMALPAQACALIGRFSDARVAESALTLLPHLKKRGVRALLPDSDPLDAPADLVTRVPEDQIAERADLVIAIGGDGTLLYAARLVAHRGVPLIGINRGRLGFLTDVLPQDMLASVDAALEGRCERDERALLEARLCSSDGSVDARAGAQRRGTAEVGNRPHAGFRNLDRRRLREYARRRRSRRGQLHRIDGLCALLRRAHRRAAPGCAGRGADLSAHACPIAPSSCPGVQSSP